MKRIPLVLVLALAIVVSLVASPVLASSADNYKPHTTPTPTTSHTNHRSHTTPTPTKSHTTKLFHYNGTVKAINATNLTLTLRTGKDVQITLNTSTHIHGSIKVGDSVSVVVISSKSSPPVATNVTLLSSKSKKH